MEFGLSKQKWPMTVPSLTFEEKQMFLDGLKSLLLSSILTAAFQQKHKNLLSSSYLQWLLYLIQNTETCHQKECMSVFKVALR